MMRTSVFLILVFTYFAREIESSSPWSKNSTIDKSRLEKSCMVNRNNFNRSCIYDKIFYLMRKFPLITGLPFFRMVSFELIKLPDYATSVVSVNDEIPNFRSFPFNILSLVSKSVEYFLHSYGIKIPVPSLSRNFPGIILDEYSNDTSLLNEARHRKKNQKKFALIFPLIATFKFILIKALLIPILMGIVAIKKMLIVAAMAVPAIIAMLRICRFGPGFGGILGGAGLTAAAATPVVAAPYVASDTIIGDFSHINPAMIQQTPYYNKQQDYGGKSFGTSLTTY